LVIIAHGSQLVTRKGFTGINFIEVGARTVCVGSVAHGEVGGVRRNLSGGQTKPNAIKRNPKQKLLAALLARRNCRESELNC
jgi:hypothetical protein